jgi:hypothetical protein
LNAQRLIGGIGFVSLVSYPTANWDFAGNAAIDGSGADLTGNLSIVATTFATTVKFDVTNTSASQAVYLIEPGGTTGPKLRIRGKGVYDRGPQTYQASSPQAYGTRPIDIDMPYQSDPNIGQSGAEYVVASYKTLSDQVMQITFAANDSGAHMLLALTVEPGDRVLVTEPVTGISAITATVQAIELDVTEKFMTVKLDLAPVSPFVNWLWGIAGKSEWDFTTVYGF